MKRPPRPSAASITERLKAKFGPLFSSASAEPLADVPVATAPVPRPTLPPLPDQMYRPEPGDVQDARVAISGPSPLMLEAYNDLHATADKLLARNTRGLEIGDGPKTLYRTLLLCALGNARIRGLRRVPDVAELHLPAELLALVLGVARTTIWRWATELGEQVNKETGEVTGLQLVARWDHKTAVAPIAASASLDAQETRNKAKGKRPRAARPGVSDGLLWAVSMTGPRRALRVSQDALKHQWRDLLADSLAANKAETPESALRTVFSLRKAGLQQSLEGLKAADGAELAVRWTVNPGFNSQTPLYMTVARGTPALGAVWDAQSVRGLHSRERGAAVHAAALQLSAIYGDYHSVNLYHWILHRLLRLETVGINLWDIVLLLMDRVRAEQAAGEVQNAGGRLMLRLKARPKGGGHSLWDQLKDAYHVAPRGGVFA